MTDQNLTSIILFAIAIILFAPIVYFGVKHVLKLFTNTLSTAYSETANDMNSVFNRRNYTPMSHVQPTRVAPSRSAPRSQSVLQQSPSKNTTTLTHKQMKSLSKNES